MKLYLELTYWQNLKRRQMPDEMAGKFVRQILQVRITSDTQKIQSFDWPKWGCKLWHNLNSCILLGIEGNFKQSVDTLIGLAS